jgi:hypothetical protein
MSPENQPDDASQTSKCGCLKVIVTATRDQSWRYMRHPTIQQSLRTVTPTLTLTLAVTVTVTATVAFKPIGLLQHRSVGLGGQGWCSDPDVANLIGIVPHATHLKATAD